jgi:hypothetical protein
MNVSSFLKKIKRILSNLDSLSEKIENLQMALGRIEIRQLEPNSSKNLQDYEFKVTSQNGEDGIIQFLISKVPIENKVFVEFGVHDYLESNTRFLLKNNNWSGLVIDGSIRNIDYIKADPLYWRSNLKAECSFIDKDNINSIITQNGLMGDIGILSVDIDGNDYWVWESINCINPRIVICEYNAIFGTKAKVSIPYDKSFNCYQAHYSALYWGASIAAFNHLAELKGYSLVGSNINGNNIFFVRNDLLGSLQKISSEEAFVGCSFRISRDLQGNLTYLSLNEGAKLIADLTLDEIDTGKKITVKDLIEH